MNCIERKQIEKPVSAVKLGIEMPQDIVDELSKEEKACVSHHPKRVDESSITEFTNLKFRH